MDRERKKKQEAIGVSIALFSAVMWGLFPVIVVVGVKEISPLSYAALSMVIAAIGTFIYAAFTGKLREFSVRKAYVPLIMITLCIVVIPYILFFIGASKTSGVNTSVLMLSEIIFTLVFTQFIGEPTTRLKLYGAGGILVGAICILFNGTFTINMGDVLIIASTVTYPVGNFYAKKALNMVSPAMILFFRSFFGALCIFIVARIVEPEIAMGSLLQDHWIIIVLNGLILLGFAKIVWYEGLKRLDISKAISLTMTFPLFSLIILVLFYGETVSWYQATGIIIMMIGVYFSVKRQSVDPEQTLYKKQ